MTPATPSQKKPKEIPIWKKISIALILGLITGMILLWSKTFISERFIQALAHWIAFPGRLFLDLIQLIVVPLVLASVTLGICTSGNLQEIKKLGVRILLYFGLSTTLAVLIGVGVTTLIEPGKEAFLAGETVSQKVMLPPSSTSDATIFETLPDTLLSLLPDNPIHAMSESQMLQIIMMANLLGFALLFVRKEQSQPVIELLHSAQELSMTIVGWAMKLAPFAVFGLIAETTSKSGLSTFLGLAGYVTCVLIGLVLVFLGYLFVASVFGKVQPLDFIRKIVSLQALAFSTSSSAAVMPVTLQTVQKEFGVRPSIARFVIPLGVTINMDGTALYQGVATVFLAHAAGIDLTLGSLIVIIITAVGASIGTPGTPGVGIVILSGLLVNLGIPTSGIAIILGVDRILDMCRTVINVTGDVTASIVMDQWISPSSPQSSNSPGFEPY